MSTVGCVKRQEIFPVHTHGGSLLRHTLPHEPSLGIRTVLYSQFRYPRSPFCLLLSNILSIYLRFKYFYVSSLPSFSLQPLHSYPSNSHSCIITTLHGYLPLVIVEFLLNWASIWLYISPTSTNHLFLSPYSKTVVLKSRRFCPPGDIWQHLETHGR